MIRRYGTMGDGETDADGWAQRASSATCNFRSMLPVSRLTPSWITERSHACPDDWKATHAAHGDAGGGCGVGGGGGIRSCSLMSHTAELRLRGQILCDTKDGGRKRGREEEGRGREKKIDHWGRGGREEEEEEEAKKAGATWKSYRVSPISRAKLNSQPSPVGADAVALSPPPPCPHFTLVID